MKKAGKGTLAVIYPVEVYDSALAFVHGFGQTIKEMFIPSKKIAVNLDKDGKTITIFKASESRSNLGDAKEVKLSLSLVKTLEDIAEFQRGIDLAKAEIQKEITDLFEKTEIDVKTPIVIEDSLGRPA